MSACVATLPLEREHFTFAPCCCTMSGCRCHPMNRPITSRRVEIVAEITCVHTGPHKEHKGRDGRGGTYHWEAT